MPIQREAYGCSGLDPKKTDVYCGVFSLQYGIVALNLLKYVLGKGWMM